MLKNYDMSVHYHLGKVNIVADALRRLILEITTHIDDEKKELVKDVHRLARLSVRLIDSTRGGVSVHPSFESSLVVEVEKVQHRNPMFMELKDSLLIKMN